MDNQTLATKDDDSKNIVVSYRGSIAQRRAAKCGFNAERIIAVRFHAASPMVSRAMGAQSPCVTIPPGISPTALFDSPVLFPNSQVPSPSNLAQKADADYQALFPADLPIDFEFSAEFSNVNARKTCAIDPIEDVKVSSCKNANDSCGNLQGHSPDRDGELTSLPKEPVHWEDVGAQNLLEGNQQGKTNQLEMVQTSEDEYNWRKYGQKQVKGSECPRSYYKCTHRNCQVKKKVERTLDGQITKIIYRGIHNHPKPQPTGRPALGSAFSYDEMSDKRKGGGTSIKREGGMIWRNTLASMKDVKLGPNSQANGLERVSSTSVVTELSDPLSSSHGKSISTFESSENSELMSTFASHDDNDNGVTVGSISPDDESQSKRRKMEASSLEANLASRAVCEPRVVVQIESELDILDDGYRWRKYGQKVVKGNPNPRSYYKCTSAGCTVRKLVERASHNLKFVITTYEGKHNHEVPAVRNSGHVNSRGVSLLPSSADAISALALPRNAYASMPDPQIQDIAPCSERKLEFNNGYLRPTFVGNLNNEMRFGVPSLYLMKFPPLQNPYGSLGLDANSQVTQSGFDSIIHDFQILFPWSLPTSVDLSLSGFDFNNNDRKSTGQIQSFISGHHLKEEDACFVRPKQEQKDDNLYDVCLATVDHANLSSSSSVYHQAMENFPS